MKTFNRIAILAICIFSVNTLLAQTKKETIKVWGNCGMCKKVIEKAAKTAGATAASWNEDSKELNVTYNEKKTSAAKIQQSIANAGYDTQDFAASNAAYMKLPACCHYERKTTTETPAAAKTYTCPMHPSVVSNEKGKCPSCGMDLVEKKSN
ncbi:MAG: heavy metal-binding domain-containing protein [Ferruginibacter sp.]